MVRQRIDPSEVATRGLAAVATASASVQAEIDATATERFSIGDFERLLASGSGGMDLRCLLALVPDAEGRPRQEDRDVAVQCVRLAVRHGGKWKLAFHQWREDSTIVVDGVQGLLWGVGGRARQLMAMHTDVADDIVGYVKKFEERWSAAQPLDLYPTGLLYDDRAAADDAAQLLRIAANHWDDLIARLMANPALMRSLPSRSFEELVAELLDRQGLGVMLTPQTRDGGRDILATLKTPVGEHLFLVECKRFAPTRPVGVDLVRQLYGVVEMEKASAGVIVTTSSFTRDARALERTINHRMHLHEYDDLVQWLRVAKR